MPSHSIIQVDISFPLVLNDLPRLSISSCSVISLFFSDHFVDAVKAHDLAGGVYRLGTKSSNERLFPLRAGGTLAVEQHAPYPQTKRPKLSSPDHVEDS